MTRIGGIIGGLALATVQGGAASAQEGGLFCLFTTQCGAGDCTPETFTLEVAPIDHEET